MRPRVSPIRSWEYDERGRLIGYFHHCDGGYEVVEAARFGGRRRMVDDPEDAEMMAAVMTTTRQRPFPTLPRTQCV